MNGPSACNSSRFERNIARCGQTDAGLDKALEDKDETLYSVSGKVIGKYQWRMVEFHRQCVACLVEVPNMTGQRFRQEHYKISGRT